MKNWMKLISAILIVIIPAALLFADVPIRQQMTNLDCKTCHTCANPTPGNLCLRTCPSMPFTRDANSHKISEAPDSMLLDDIANLYQAVHFDHKRHARMAEMGAECATCHHNTPNGQIRPCKECHGGEANPANLRQPGLKGAYHRQCLSCHREWSHDTKCVLCHIPTPGKALSGGTVDSTDFIGISHPILTEPNIKVYRTPHKQGPIVTFRHKEHIVLFGLRCVDCHKKESCSYCHDLQKPTSMTKTDEQIHAVCNSCHRVNDCGKCHDKHERPPFTHESTGWALNQYHNKLDCRACHPTGKKVAKLNNDCASCHGGWNPDNFEHATTGLELDETHLAMDCVDCHANRKFNAQPNCSGCHDDGRTYRDMPPGKKVGKI
jgi:hypothetical protein